MIGEWISWFYSRLGWAGQIHLRISICCLLLFYPCFGEFTFLPSFIIFLFFCREAVGVSISTENSHVLQIIDADICSAGVRCIMYGSQELRYGRKLL